MIEEIIEEIKEGTSRALEEQEESRELQRQNRHSTLKQPRAQSTPVEEQKWGTPEPHHSGQHGDEGFADR